MTPRSCCASAQHVAASWIGKIQNHWLENAVFLLVNSSGSVRDCCRCGVVVVYGVYGIPPSSSCQCSCCRRRRAAVPLPRRRRGSPWMSVEDRNDICGFVVVS